MTGSLIRGDQVSCSRVGGAMRREASRLRQHAQSMVEALNDLAASTGPNTDRSLTDSSMTDSSLTDGSLTAASRAMAESVTAATVATSVQALRATADDLDEAGAALQRYATDLAEGHELGRRAQRRAEGAGLLLTGTRVVEPWGPASAQQAERRRAEAPEVQSRVDLATAQVGRARGRLLREMTRLTEGFTAHSRDAHLAGQAPLPPRGSGPAQHRLTP